MKVLTKIFKGVANEIRISILKLLINEKEMELDKISKRLRKPYKTIARHLKILEYNNFVESQLRNGIAYYKIKKDEKFPYNLMILKIIETSLKKTKILGFSRK